MGNATGPKRNSSTYKSRKWYSYIEWSISYTETQATVTVTLYFKGNNDTWGQVGKYCSGGITIAGESWSFGAGSQSWLFSNITSKKVLTKSKTINRTTSNQSIAVSGWVNLSSSSAYHSSSGKSTASGTDTITILRNWQVTYNGNGATGGSTAPQTKFYNINLPLRANGFSRTGYTFNGWWTTASGGSQYGSNYTGNGPATIYAHWNPNLYIYTYRPNNDDGGSAFTQNKYHDISVLLAKQGFTKEYYHLKKWKYKLNENDQYNEAELNSTCNINQNLTFYPIFESNTVAIQYYSEETLYYEQVISYDDTPNTITIQDPTDQTKFSNIPTKTGYHMYKTNNKFTWLIGDESVNNGDTVNWNATGYGQSNVANTIVRADLQWEPNTYTINFDGNSSYASNIPLSQTVTYDTITELPREKPIRQGYSFMGWKDAHNNIYQPGEAILQNLTSEDGVTTQLVAQWELIVNRIQINNYAFDRASDINNFDGSSNYIAGEINYFPGYYWDEDQPGNYINCAGETFDGLEVYYIKNDDVYEVVLNPTSENINSYYRVINKEVAFDFEKLDNLDNQQSESRELRKVEDLSDLTIKGYFEEKSRQSEVKRYISCEGKTFDQTTTYYTYNDQSEEYEIVNNPSAENINLYFIYTADYLDYNVKRSIKFLAYTKIDGNPNWQEFDASELKSYQIYFSIKDAPSQESSIEKQTYKIIDPNQEYKLSPVSFIIDVNKTGDKIAFGGPSNDDKDNNKGVYIALNNSLYITLENNGSPEAILDGSILQSLTNLNWDDVLIQIT